MVLQVKTSVNAGIAKLVNWGSGMDLARCERSESVKKNVVSRNKTPRKKNRVTLPTKIYHRRPIVALPTALLQSIAKCLITASTTTVSIYFDYSSVSARLRSSPCHWLTMG